MANTFMLVFSVYSLSARLASYIAFDNAGKYSNLRT
ncbi:MAG: hypothetical protein ACI96P_002511 [Candidatus Azotimanducaceae bacterium]